MIFLFRVNSGVGLRLMFLLPPSLRFGCPLFVPPQLASLLLCFLLGFVGSLCLFCSAVLGLGYSVSMS